MLIQLVLSMTILMLQWQGQVVVTSLNGLQSLKYLHFVPLLTLPSVCVLSTSIALFKSHRWFWFACFASFPNEDVILVHSCQAPSALPSVFLYRLSFCFTPALPSWHPLLPGYIKLPAIPQHTAPCQAGDLLYTGPSSSNWRMKYSSRPNMHNNSKHCQSLTT